MFQYKRSFIKLYMKFFIEKRKQKKNEFSHKIFKRKMRKTHENMSFFYSVWWSWGSVGFCWREIEINSTVCWMKKAKQFPFGISWDEFMMPFKFYVFFFYLFSCTLKFKIIYFKIEWVRWSCSKFVDVRGKVKIFLIEIFR